MTTYDEMYVLSKDDYENLKEGNELKLQDSIGGDVQGSQVNNIELGNGRVVVIQGDEPFSKLPQISDKSDKKSMKNNKPSKKIKSKEQKINNGKIEKKKDKKNKKEKHVANNFVYEDDEVSFPNIPSHFQRQSAFSSFSPASSQSPNNNQFNSSFRRTNNDLALEAARAGRDRMKRLRVQDEVRSEVINKIPSKIHVTPSKLKSNYQNVRKDYQDRLVPQRMDFSSFPSSPTQFTSTKKKSILKSSARKIISPKKKVSIKEDENKRIMKNLVDERLLQLQGINPTPLIKSIKPTSINQNNMRKSRTSPYSTIKPYIKSNREEEEKLMMDQIHNRLSQPQFHWKFGKRKRPNIPTPPIKALKSIEPVRFDLSKNPTNRIKRKVKKVLRSPQSKLNYDDDNMKANLLAGIKRRMEDISQEEQEEESLIPLKTSRHDVSDDYELW